MYVLHAEDNISQMSILLPWNFNTHWWLLYYDADAIVIKSQQPEMNGQNWVDRQVKAARYLQGSNLNLVGEVVLKDFFDLSSLWLFNNNLSSIDVSGCPKLKILMAQHNPQLKRIILPHGFDISKETKFQYDHDHPIEIIIK
jgi:hypothetical protein